MHGPAFSSVTGTTCPSGRNTCVIPIFLPRIPGLIKTSRSERVGAGEFKNSEFKNSRISACDYHHQLHCSFQSLPLGLAGGRAKPKGRAFSNSRILEFSNSAFPY